MGRALDKLNLLYTFHESPMDYATAQSICQAGGGSLAMPRSPQQWEELLAARRSEDVQLTDSVWLGLNAMDGGTWRWNSGDDVTWSNWMDGQPDGSGLCGVWYTRDPPASWAQADRWDDWGCAENLTFACQTVDYSTSYPYNARQAGSEVQKRGNEGEDMKPRRRPKKLRRPPPERRPMAQRPKGDDNDINERNMKNIERLLDVLTKHKKTE